MRGKGALPCELQAVRGAGWRVFELTGEHFAGSEQNASDGAAIEMEIVEVLLQRDGRGEPLEEVLDRKTAVAEVRGAAHAHGVDPSRFLEGHRIVGSLLLLWTLVAGNSLRGVGHFCQAEAEGRVEGEPDGHLVAVGELLEGRHVSGTDPDKGHISHLGEGALCGKRRVVQAKAERQVAP